MSATTEFFQDPPRLGHPYLDDRGLRLALRRLLPREVLAEVEPSLLRVGELAGGRLAELAFEHRLDEPVHIPFDPWGRRIDEVRVNPVWKECARVAAEEGLVATAYERAHGALSRVHHFALVYLFAPSSQLYTCPLAMTDGCARTLETMAPAELRERVLPRLVTRDPDRMWTAGQWMTERIGGSDVGLSEAVARQMPDGWRLWGTKWFVSAVTADVALTLARPEGNGPGGKGLALFFVQVRDPSGRLNGITIHRLKEKLGTRHLPTAEIRLEGTFAEPVAGLAEGVRNITTVLNRARAWNTICAVAGMRRGLALARDYARRRVAFGAPIAEKPLQLETLADLAAEQEGALLLALEVARVLGLEEAGELDTSGAARLRLLLPVAKLVTAKQAVAHASEVLEAFGGAGYVEDTGLPQLLRDAQVLPIWEGTTNVLSLEAYRAILRTEALAPTLEDARSRLASAADARLAEPVAVARCALEHAEAWWAGARRRGAWAHEAMARRFALTLGRTLELVLLLEQAQFALTQSGDGRAAAAARRLARLGVDLLAVDDPEPDATAAVALEEPQPLD